MTAIDFNISPSAETASLKVQIQLERDSLREEKRALDRERSEWKLTAMNEKAEIKLLRDAAKERLTDATSSEANAMRAHENAQRCTDCDYFQR